MRVLLIPPTYRYATEYPAFLSFSDFPSGFGYLAAALKQAGHKVYGCSPNNIVGYANAWLMLQDVITREIKEVNPGLVGLGGICTDYKFLQDAIGIIRALRPSLPIVLGGQIVTNDAKDIFHLLKPDFAIVGEGEEAIVQLVTYLSNGDNLKPDNLWYWENGEAKKTSSSRTYRDLDTIPFPNYEPFGIKEMLDEYSHATRVLYRYSRSDARPYNIVASRGCPFACTFCIDHHRGYRTRSIANIMDEIRDSYERYGFNVLIILDELFAINKQRMIDFCAAIHEGKRLYKWDFDWMFQTHANARLDKKTLELAKEAGCFLFSYGLESASPAVLKSMRKHIKIEQVENAIKMAEEVGIGFAANLIFGDIAETMETAAESLSFWFKYGVSSNIFLALVSPYPGSLLFEACRRRGMFPDKRDYYVHIDEAHHNITDMTDVQFEALKHLISYLEGCWLFVRQAELETCEIFPINGKLKTYTGGQYYRISLNCPYCGKRSEYRQLNKGLPFMLGLGCAKCNRRIKVEVS